jgi:dTDP-glucose 4,6-dehydratase
VTLDRLTYAGFRKNLAEVENDPRHTFVEGDVCNRELVAEIMGECDIVVHFAAESHVERSITDPNEFIRSNVLGTSVLLNCARDASIDEFVYMSTDEVYGSIESGEFVEEDCFSPSSPYAASKAGADHLVQSHYTTYDQPVKTIRCTNNYGPYQNPEKLIPLFITNLLEDESVPLYGSGDNVRDWIHVQDTCTAILTVLEQGNVGEVYNVAGQQHRSNIKITNQIIDILDKDDSYIDHVEDRPGHDFRYAVDDSKLRLLGWKPNYQFEEGLADTIQWYKNNTKWWKGIKASE